MTSYDENMSRIRGVRKRNGSRHTVQRLYHYSRKRGKSEKLTRHIHACSDASIMEIAKCNLKSSPQKGQRRLYRVES